MTVQEKELKILRENKAVSIFWVTETQARAQRITKLEKSGVLVRHKDDPRDAFPWCVFTVEDKL